MASNNTKYRDESDFYSKAKTWLDMRCRELCEDNNIKCFWESRVKDAVSLEKKLRGRATKNQNEKENVDDIKDLVGGRFCVIST